MLWTWFLNIYTHVINYYQSIQVNAKCLIDLNVHVVAYSICLFMINLIVKEYIWGAVNTFEYIFPRSAEHLWVISLQINLCTSENTQEIADMSYEICHISYIIDMLSKKNT